MYRGAPRPGATCRPLARRERSRIAWNFAERGIPGGCVGIVDGCLVVLANKPRRKDGADFHSYKQRYGFNVMGVCDDQKRIRAVQYGFVGSAHDNRVFKFSPFYNRPADFFSPTQYLLADSAYTPTTFCVPLFKREAGAVNLGRGEVKHNFIFSSLHIIVRAEFGSLQKLFNDECASTRVLIEHTFGMLKNRWSCLRGLRISIEDKDDEGCATCWIRACVVLHNLLIETADVFLDDNRDYPAGDAAEPDLARAEQDPLTHPTRLVL